MLVDVDLNYRDAISDLIAVTNGKSLTPIRHYTGIYESGDWSFELKFRGKQDYTLDYPDLGEFSCYGVCDSPVGLLERLPERVKASDTKYVINMVKLEKKNQESEGGWRWHKWGPYIGKQSPTTEYLYDEPLIEEVYTYQVYQVE